MTGKCFFCGDSEQTEQCDICHISSYCEEHEHIHKHSSDETCYPWRVETREGVGRVVIAERDIQCHEIVLDEEPVGVSPTQDSPLLCLACFKLLDPDTALECECGFLMCNESCCQHQRHQPEHQLFVSSGRKGNGRQSYPMIMPIRLLHEWEDNSRQLKDKASRMMNHREERIKETRNWNWVTERIVRPILEISSSKSWTEDDIQDCVGFIRYYQGIESNENTHLKPNLILGLPE